MILQTKTEVLGDNCNMYNKTMYKHTDTGRLKVKNFISKKRFFVIFTYIIQIVNKIMKFRGPKLAFKRGVHRFSKSREATSIL
jgi:hypothetical protein